MKDLLNKLHIQYSITHAQYGVIKAIEKEAEKLEKEIERLKIKSNYYAKRLVLLGEEDISFEVTEAV